MDSGASPIIRDPKAAGRPESLISRMYRFVDIKGMEDHRTYTVSTVCEPLLSRVPPGDAFSARQEGEYVYPDSLFSPVLRRRARYDLWIRCSCLCKDLPVHLHKNQNSANLSPRKPLWHWKYHLPV